MDGSAAAVGSPEGPLAAGLLTPPPPPLPARSASGPAEGGWPEAGRVLQWPASCKRMRRDSCRPHAEDSPATSSPQGEQRKAQQPAEPLVAAAAAPGGARGQQEAAAAAAAAGPGGGLSEGRQALSVELSLEDPDWRPGTSQVRELPVLPMHAEAGVGREGDSTPAAWPDQRSPELLQRAQLQSQMGTGLQDRQHVDVSQQTNVPGSAQIFEQRHLRSTLLFAAPARGFHR
jgi:hypothetical protein